MRTCNADARDIIGNPRSSHSASLRLLAWATLKAERGQTICQRRLQSKPATQLMFPRAKPVEINQQSQIETDAKEVVNNPARFADQPSQRLLAWAVLMGQRALSQGGC